MKIFTANEAKQLLGRVMITKHGRPEFVLNSKDDYDSMAELKYQHLKQEVQKGFDEIDRGDFSETTFEQIAAEVGADFEQG